MSTIGNRIKIRREELGLSQDELARRLGYKSRSSINKIELDQRNLTQSKIKAIADALETTPSYIMGWDELDQTLDLVKLQQEVAKAKTAIDSIEREYGSTVADTLNLFVQLDAEDQAEVRGMIRGLLTKEKYLSQEGLKNA